jgi:hypothetical protein
MEHKKNRQKIRFVNLRLMYGLDAFIIVSIAAVQHRQRI